MRDLILEPERQTLPELAGVLAELQAREPLFHRLEFGTSRTDFENMTEAGFWEPGASGRRYSRDFVLQELEHRHHSQNTREDRWQVSDFYCQQLADNVYLLTYTLQQPDRLTRRATIWKRDGQGWKAVYHQGTAVPQA